MAAPVVVTGVRNLPKKPVRWWGTAVIYLRDGGRTETSWNSRGAMTVEQARLAMVAAVEQMVKEVDKDEAVDSGFVMQCR